MIIKNHEFEWLKFNIMQRTPPGVFTEISQAEELSLIMQECVLNVKSFVLGQRLPPETKTIVNEFHCEWPETTWQMFKYTHQDSWWLKWLVRKFPVKNKIFHEKRIELVSWDKKVVFPDQTYFKYPDSMGRPIVLVSAPEIKPLPYSEEKPWNQE